MSVNLSGGTHSCRQPSISLSGYPRVSSDMLCILTRMRMRRWWQLVPAYCHYRRIKSRSLRSPGLLRFAFAVELPRTIYTNSLWANEEAIPRWAIHEHVAAVHWAFRQADEIWSTEWRLSGLSSRACWNGQDVIPKDIQFFHEAEHVSDPE
jgi:hypothetical protein